MIIGLPHEQDKPFNGLIALKSLSGHSNGHFANLHTSLYSCYIASTKFEQEM